MHLNEISDGPEVLTSRIADLRRRLGEILRRHQESLRRFVDLRAKLKQETQEAEARAAAEFEARRREIEEGAARRRREIEEAGARRLERIEQAFSNSATRMEERSAREIDRLLEEERRAAGEAVRALRREMGPRFAGPSAERAEIRRLLEETRRLREEIARRAAGLGISPRIPAPDPTGEVPPDLPAWARRELDELRRRLEELPRSGRARLARIAPRLPSLVVLILLLHGALVGILYGKAPERLPEALPVAPYSLGGLLLAALLFRLWVRGGVRAAVLPPLTGAADLEVLLRRREAALEEQLTALRREFFEKRADRIAEVEERYRSLQRQARAAAETRREILLEQRNRLAEKARDLTERRRAREAARREEERRALEEEARRGAPRRKADHLRREEALAAEERAERERLGGEWAEAIRRFLTEGREACRRSRERHPPLDVPISDAPAAFPTGVRLGEIRFEMESLLSDPENPPPFPCAGFGPAVFPLDLSFPARGGLFLAADPEDRGRALRTLLAVTLRILRSFPPGKARFILFDPVGLGQSFSALMHLADFDESLVGGRIWTETVHIERKLSELTEHIEKVIQKYLRNRYRSIDEYNREAAQLAEAYRFLVVADFPTGFSELALEKLAGILTSGPRCGVYPLVLRNRKQKLPAPLNPAILREAGLPLEALEGGYRPEGEPLDRGILIPDDPPPEDRLTGLLQEVGRRCAEAGRVELDFSLIAPPEGREWSQDTEAGIRIPLGRSGADRVQSLELGRGTAQHALVAGKTGSGKSTLFHVMITNAALWFSPRELELYLIDFKKGVEFKTYAVHRLPHVRVVAIESDREFGLSVLRRVDRELTLRAERFRRLEVQEFAACRRADPGTPLPRTLLLIDEFQEFFTEEDAVAQEAALLLDRIVRQGRAFGIHVVLGSQTLGGSYTLAKATLGQMAVRIALQCNEADSYLILSDDNAAARLLSRPGEAIYNDQSGMVEGNTPFQVCWLPDEVRERQLERVARKAAAEPSFPSEPTVVFEGNVPADLRNNLLLRERLARPFREDTGDSVACWVGEANAIKGPTEVRFRAQPGSNLLVAGANRESALSVEIAAVLGLAAAAPPDRARFRLLDGSPPELGHDRHFAALGAAIPQGLERLDYARLGDALRELDTEVQERAEGRRPADRRIFLVIHDLQRFRPLRQRSEFDLSSSEADERAPDRCLSRILSDGPAQKVHTILWADSVNTLNRMLGRKLLKEFQIRILFQMSGSDSSELIDTPAAASLGLYRGLLYLEDEGTIEKFRPYALPDGGVWKEIHRQLSAVLPP